MENVRKKIGNVKKERSGASMTEETTMMQRTSGKKRTFIWNKQNEYDRLAALFKEGHAFQQSDHR